MVYCSSSQIERVPWLCLAPTHGIGNHCNGILVDVIVMWPGVPRKSSSPCGLPDGVKSFQSRIPVSISSRPGRSAGEALGWPLHARQVELGNTLRAFDGLVLILTAGRSPTEFSSIPCLATGGLCQQPIASFVCDFLRTCPASPTSSSSTTPNQTSTERCSALSRSSGSCTALAVYRFESLSC